jgi:undecaprenyl-diphosphatase
VLGDTVVEDGRRRMDDAILRFAHAHHRSHVTSVMLWGSEVASAPVVVPLMLMVCALLLFRRRRAEALLIALVWIGGQALHVGLKMIYERPRPSLFPALVHAGGFSFPSGHTVTAVMTYGLLALLIGRSRASHLRYVGVVAASLIILWVGLSRVYLGVHYATDVLGSLLIAGAWLRCSMIALDQFVPKRATELGRPSI